MRASHEDPFERSARPGTGRASFRIAALPADDPSLSSTLREWDWVSRSLLSGGAVSAPTRVRLEDSRRIVGELARVLDGAEPGEGPPDARRVLAALAGGRIQGLVTTFACPRAVFVELLATAPWNLLAPGDPPDGRGVRGAGRALLDEAERMGRRGGQGGRVALQAENPRALELYERLGFERMLPSDAPLALVPRGDDGWSPAVIRLACKRASREDAASPWLLRDPERLRARGAAPYAAATRIRARSTKVFVASGLRMTVTSGSSTP